jgi:hypothetical protein
MACANNRRLTQDSEITTVILSHSVPTLPRHMRQAALHAGTRHSSCDCQGSKHPLLNVQPLEGIMLARGSDFGSQGHTSFNAAE